MKHFNYWIIAMFLQVFFSVNVNGQEKVTAFINANVISMDNNSVINNQTVLVEGSKIKAIGFANELLPPSNSTVIDCKGLYLLPGLVDSHVHLDKEIGARPDFGDAPLFLAYGITTVFNLRGEPAHVELKRKIENGELVAPNLYNSGEFVNEPRVVTSNEAEQEVYNQINCGYDIIKFREVVNFEDFSVLTTTGMEREAYMHLNKVAKSAGIPIVGHAPYNVGLIGLLQSKQSIAHMNELANLYFLPPLNFSSGLMIKLAILSILFSVLLLVLWFLVNLGRRLFTAMYNREYIYVKKFVLQFSFLTAVAVFTFLLWVVTTPPGIYFGNIVLLVLLSIVCIILLGTLLLMFKTAIKIYKELSVGIFQKILNTLSLGLATCIVFSLGYWSVFAWRGSDVVINSVANDCQKAGIYIQSTLICQENFMGIKEGFLHEQVVNDSLFQYLDTSMQEQWKGFANYKLPKIIMIWKRQPEFLRKITGILHMNGVQIMAGTDAMGAPLIIPGVSLHKEMQLLNESGMTNYEVLRAATVIPSRFLNKDNEFGTISVGKRADILLVSDNPLENLSNLTKIQGVMVRGVWLTKDLLNRNLANLKAK